MITVILSSLMDELLIGDLEFALAKQLVGCTKLQVTTLNERLCVPQQS
jgi:hypothetical protein